MAESGKSMILFNGGTGYIGKFIVEASANAGHPTFVLVRESTLSNPTKSSLIDKFKNLGVNLVFGDLFDHQSLVNATKQVDVVISTVGHLQLADQDKIISAIKEAGNVKAKIRRSIEAEGIPYTYASTSFFAGYFLPNLSQPESTAAPRVKVVIFGDGNPEAIFNKEEDLNAILLIYHSCYVKGDQTYFEIEPSLRWKLQRSILM